MQPYQSYSGMMNQPIPNSYGANYGNYGAAYNGGYGYYDKSMYQQQQAPGLAGKYVQRFEDITANDVPMDGGYAFFIKSDLSESCAKAWQADGTIRTIYFKPVLDVLPSNSTNTTSDVQNVNTEAIQSLRNDVLGKLTELDGRLERIETGFKPATRKKEVLTNE